MGASPVAHAYYPSTWGTEARGSQVRGQPGLCGGSPVSKDKQKKTKIQPSVPQDIWQVYSVTLILYLNLPTGCLRGAKTKHKPKDKAFPSPAQAPYSCAWQENSKEQASHLQCSSTTPNQCDKQAVIACKVYRDTERIKTIGYINHM